VHPFLSSHEEKWPWLELSMGGGHDRSWSSMGAHGELAGEGKEGGRGEGEGARGWGRHG
jgi:hypothetical protein